MPLSFTGNTSSSATSESISLPTLVTYFTLIPKSNAIVNVYKITTDLSQICIIPSNTSISSGSMWEGECEILLSPTEQIKVQTNVSLDYNFTINNVEP